VEETRRKLYRYFHFVRAAEYSRLASGRRATVSHQRCRAGHIDPNMCAERARTATLSLGSSSRVGLKAKPTKAPAQGDDRQPKGKRARAPAGALAPVKGGEDGQLRLGKLTKAPAQLGADRRGAGEDRLRAPELERRPAGDATDVVGPLIGVKKRARSEAPSVSDNRAPENDVPKEVFAVCIDVSYASGSSDVKCPVVHCPGPIVGIYAHERDAVAAAVLASFLPAQIVGEFTRVEHQSSSPDYGDDDDGSPWWGGPDDYPWGGQDSDDPDNLMEKMEEIAESFSDWLEESLQDMHRGGLTDSCEDEGGTALERSDAIQAALAQGLKEWFRHVHLPSDITASVHLTVEAQPLRLTRCEPPEDWE
jgi:hypothetical protein